MGSLRALLMAGAVATGAASVAHAADLPPPPQLAPTILPEPDYGGWYIRGDVGVGSAVLEDFTSSAARNRRVPGFRIDQRHLDDSAFAGGGVGYAFNSWIRFDVTGEFRTAQRFSAIESFNSGAFVVPPTRARGFDVYNASIQSSVVLANAYVDLFHWCGFTPYIGGGAGVAFNRINGLSDLGTGNNAGFGFAKDAQRTNFAWAAMAGVSFDVTQNVKLDLGYRFLNMGNVSSNPIICRNTGFCPKEVQKFNLASNDIRLGLRWMFNSAGPFVSAGPVAPYPVAYEPALPPPAPVYQAPARAPGPVVRRY